MQNESGKFWTSLVFFLITIACIIAMVYALAQESPKGPSSPGLNLGIQIGAITAMVSLVIATIGFIRYRDSTRNIMQQETTLRGISMFLIIIGMMISPVLLFVLYIVLSDSK